MGVEGLSLLKTHIKSEHNTVKWMVKLAQKIKFNSPPFPLPPSPSPKYKYTHPLARAPLQLGTGK